MQLLYANDGINYRTISKSLSLTSSVEKVLLESYLKYDFVSYNEAYSSISNEPEAITYAISNLNNELPNNHLIVCKAGHMSNFATPSYYFHVLIETVNDDFFKEKFFEIFDYQFIKDSQISNYHHCNIDEYQFTNNRLNTIALNNEQLITILASFMNNEKSNKKTKIIVDTKGDLYNSRAREILASIYHYLPYQLRKRHGFITYSKEGKSESGRVSFLLYALDELRNINNTFIQLDNINIKALSTSIEEKYLNYAKYLVLELDQESRKAHFEQLTKIAINGRLKIDDCITYYDNLTKWQAGTQEELLPEWITYVNQHSFRKGPLYKLMVEIIQTKITNEYYNKYLFEKILDLYKESINSLSFQAIKVIRFVDCLNNLKINKLKFNQWYELQLANKIKGLDINNPKDIIKYKKILEDEIIILADIDIGSEQLKLLLSNIIKDLKDARDKINDKLNQFVDIELNRIKREFLKLQEVSVKEFKVRSKELNSSLIFSESINLFKTNVKAWIGKKLCNNFILEPELVEYNNYIDENKNAFDQAEYQKFKAIIESKLTIINEKKKAKVFKITTQTSLMSNYKALQIYISKGILKLEDEVELTLGITSKLITVAALESLLAFILVPVTLAPVVNEHLEQLYNLKLLSVQHYKYLIAASDGNNVKRTIDYFFKEFNPIEISGLYVANELAKYAPESVKKIVESYQDDDNKEIILFVNQFNKRGEKANQTKKKSFGSFFK